MVYRVIGLMSGSSLDGLDIAFVHLQESAGKWNFEIIQSACYAYDDEWKKKLQAAPGLTALEYQLLHTSYGHWLGESVNHFIAENELHYKVQLISSHGHTCFHLPGSKMTAQLGDGAALAAATRINVVSDLRSLDIALGGQGAPIVPIGEKLLFPGFRFFLNLGGIANISYKSDDNRFTGFDVCAANRVLNILANHAGREYDQNGEIAMTGQVNEPLLHRLNELSYYGDPYPKSLPNEFGTGIVYPMIMDAECGTADGLRTYVDHISIQVARAASFILQTQERETRGVIQSSDSQMLVTGGGAFNGFLMEKIKNALQPLGIEVIVPDEKIIQFKEALIMALIGILRWREEYNTLASVTGAGRDGIGGAVWIGQEA